MYPVYQYRPAAQAGTRNIMAFGRDSLRHTSEFLSGSALSRWRPPTLPDSGDKFQRSVKGHGSWLTRASLLSILVALRSSIVVIVIDDGSTALLLCLRFALISPVKHIFSRYSFFVRSPRTISIVSLSLSLVSRAETMLSGCAR